MEKGQTTLFGRILRTGAFLGLTLIPPHSQMACSKIENLFDDPELNVTEVELCNDKIIVKIDLDKKTVVYTNKLNSTVYAEILDKLENSLSWVVVAPHGETFPQKFEAEYGETVTMNIYVVGLTGYSLCDTYHFTLPTEDQFDSNSKKVIELNLEDGTAEIIDQTQDQFSESYQSVIESNIP